LQTSAIYRTRETNKEPSADGIVYKGERMKNVQIPKDLFYRIIDLLGCWDISKYDISVQDEYNTVINELDMKLSKMELRDNYKAIITAGDEDTRDFARINYLRGKQQNRNN